MIILALVGMHGSSGGGGSKKKKHDAADLDREALLPLAVQCLVALLRLCVTPTQLRRVVACLPAVTDADLTPGMRARKNAWNLLTFGQCGLLLPVHPENTIMTVMFDCVSCFWCTYRRC